MRHHPVTTPPAASVSGGSSAQPSGRCGVLAGWAVEQVMRLTDDMLLAAQVAWCPSAGRRQVCGQVSSLLPPLSAGSPLLVWANHGSMSQVDSRWRLTLPPKPDSLMAELQLLRTLHGDTQLACGRHVNPFEELQLLRHRQV